MTSDNNWCGYDGGITSVVWLLSLARYVWQVSNRQKTCKNLCTGDSAVWEAKEYGGFLTMTHEQVHILNWFALNKGLVPSCLIWRPGKVCWTASQRPVKSCFKTISWKGRKRCFTTKRVASSQFQTQSCPISPLITIPGPTWFLSRQVP